MQISKRLAQNIVEFSFVFPILVIMTLVIYEIAYFWQEVDSIYNLNNELAAQAAIAEFNPNTTALGATCTAAQGALDYFKKKAPLVTGIDSDYTKTTLLNSGMNEPFALYKYASKKTTTSTGEPLITLWVDCRSPYEEGVTTQIEFYHRTMVIRASIPRFDGGDPIVIIPQDIFIASPKVSSIRHY